MRDREESMVVRGERLTMALSGASAQFGQIFLVILLYALYHLKPDVKIR